MATPELRNCLDEIVSSFENFKYRTRFPICLYNRIAGEQSGSSVFMTALNSNSTNAATLLAAYDTIFLAEESEFSEDNTKLLFTNETAFMQQLVNTFSEKLDPVGPYYDKGNNSDDTRGYPVSYLANVRTLCDEVFKLYFVQLTARCAPSATDCADFKTGISKETAILVNTVVITNEIVGKIYEYIDDVEHPSLDLFLQKLYEGIADYYMTNPVDGRAGKYNWSHLNLFFLCYLPYFYMLFITSYIPARTIVGTNKAPRNQDVRGIAILAMYKFTMYIMFGAYKVITRHDPSIELAVQMRQNIDLNTTMLFNKESEALLGLGNTIADTRSVQTALTSLSDTNREIEMARSNINNILVNNVDAVREVKRNTSIKWAWFSFWIIYLATWAVFFFLKDIADGFLKNQVEIFFIISLCLLLVVSIFGLVSMSKKV
jgi:hypothetical protein